MIIRYGMLESQGDNNGNIPDCFKKEKLSPLNIEATAWWDETHKVCDIGGNGNRYFPPRLPQYSNIIIDLKNGQYNKDLNMYKFKVKNDKEVQMYLGCDIIHKKDADGKATTVEGKRFMNFEYSGRVILSVNDYKEKIKKEIARVKALKNDTLGIRILYSGHMEGSLYRNKKTMKLTRLREKTFGRLALQGVSTVAHMKALTDDTIQIMASSYSKLKASSLPNWRQEAQTCLDEDAPACEDFSTAVNPYEARFGY